MQLGRVMGRAVATIKAPGLEGVKLLIVQRLDKNKQPFGTLQIAADGSRQAGVGDLVFLVRAREAALTLEESFVPVDLAVLGVVDHISVDATIDNFELPRGYSRF